MKNVIVCEAVKRGHCSNSGKIFILILLLNCYLFFASVTTLLACMLHRHFTQSNAHHQCVYFYFQMLGNNNSICFFLLLEFVTKNGSKAHRGFFYFYCLHVAHILTRSRKKHVQVGIWNFFFPSKRERIT